MCLLHRSFRKRKKKIMLAFRLGVLNIPSPFPSSMNSEFELVIPSIQGRACLGAVLLVNLWVLRALLYYIRVSESNFCSNTPRLGCNVDRLQGQMSSLNMKKIRIESGITS